VTENSLLLTFVIAITVVVVIVLGSARRGTGQRDKSACLEKLRRSGHYWGVKIRPGKCDAIRHFAGRRFTFHEAPALPLAGCRAWRCTCTYLGLPERRSEHRRVRHDRRANVRFDGDLGERRSIQGRRNRDKAWKDPAD
jgi:hypothetical protein